MMMGRVQSETYFSCLASDKLVRLCFLRFLGSLAGPFLGHFIAQLGKLLAFLLFRERFDLLKTSINENCLSDKLENARPR